MTCRCLATWLLFLLFNEQVAEKVLSDRLAVLQKDLYTQDASRLGKCCQSIIAIAARCIALVRNQDGGHVFAEKIYLKEVELGNFL